MQAGPRRVVIVGGGIAGLATAYALTEAAARRVPPVSCTLFEAAPRLGGKVLTEQTDGFVIEGGPDSFLAQKPWGLELCRRLGLTDKVIGTDLDQRRTFVLSEGRLRPLPEGLVMGLPTKLAPFLWTNLLSWPGKLRLAGDLLVPRRRQEGDESLGAFFRRRVGREALERLIEPLLSGIYAGDVDQLSLLATFPRFREMERESGSLIRSLTASWWRQRAQRGEALPWTPFITLRNGLGELVQALSARLDAGTVKICRRVQEVRPGPAAGRYEVIAEGVPPLAADAVVFATPAYETASLVEPLNRTLAEMLRGIPYASTVTVSLAFRKEGIGHPLNGYGFVVPRTERRPLLACTWMSSKWRHRAPQHAVLIRSYMGGMGREHVMDRSDGELVKQTRGELQAIMGIEEEPLWARVYRWPRGMPQYLVGHLDRLATMESLLERLPGIFLTGAAYRGVGLPDCIREGTLTAERILAYFDKNHAGSV